MGLSENALLACLAVILGLVLVLPFLAHKVEEELELFFLAMGVAAVTVSGLWDRHLVVEALTGPIKIASAVLVFGLVFRWCRGWIHHHIAGLARVMGLGAFLFAAVVGLGLLSSVITVIVASLVLVEVVAGVGLSEKDRTAVVIIACFAIGLGAALTPVGEPLSTIATLKLAGPPYHADFFFLARILWYWLLPGIVILGFLAAFWVRRAGHAKASQVKEEPETLAAILGRAGKVYAFVAALVLLGRGFTPVVDRYLVRMPGSGLYWLNTLSAVLDNATLAAAEISPKMDINRIVFLLMGILIAGGMLIPGNVPNIICAKQLRIRSRAWARLGLPLGAALMAVYFVLLRWFLEGV